MRLIFCNAKDFAATSMRDWWNICSTGSNITKSNSFEKVKGTWTWLNIIISRKEGSCGEIRRPTKKTMKMENRCVDRM